jgi:signal transduction histidine kinase/CheY-like chemotaxis protein
MKPKPFSVQLRFFVLQSTSIVLGLLFIGAAIFVTLRIREEVGAPVEKLKAALPLREEVQESLEQLETSTEQMREYTRILYLLLTGFGLYAVLVIRIFRRNHREQLWEPLAELMETVRQARRGNFNVQPRVPRSVEVGPLVESFASLTGEVRAMRESLEQKVKERTAELEAAQKQLLQAAKLSAVGQLVSGVAHEVNNPLTSILGFSEVLLGHPELDAASRRQLEIIRDEALRVRDLVTHLTRFARRAPHRTVRVDLRRVLERVVELRRYQLTAGGIRLHYEPPAQAVWVEGDPDQLLQVLFNLVLNAEQAIEAERGEGDIWLACARLNGTAVFEVRDNGAGMTAEVAERIFEPFFTTKPVGQGTGLGLSISHGIVEQHSGRIVVNSTPGASTTMRIELPAAAPLDSTAVAQPAPQEAPLSAGRALVIDDEEGITSLVQLALERRGWSVVTLTDSTKAEGALESAGFDIVISDLKMPGTTGIEILSLLRKKHPELAKRFLLMTGDLGDTDKRLLARAKIPVLRKPFTLAQLSEAVRAVMESQPS